MAEVTVKYLTINGEFQQKSMYVSPTSTKIQRKHFDMNFDDEVLLCPGGQFFVDVMFNNNKYSGEIVIPRLPTDVSRWYSDGLFCELHGNLVKGHNRLPVFEATKMHVNLSKAISKMMTHKPKKGGNKDTQMDDVLDMKRALSAKKKVIDSMTETTKTYLKTMESLSTRLELLESLIDDEGMKQ